MTWYLCSEYTDVVESSRELLVGKRKYLIAFQVVQDWKARINAKIKTWKEERKKERSQLNTFGEVNVLR